MQKVFANTIAFGEVSSNQEEVEHSNTRYFKSKREQDTTYPVNQRLQRAAFFKGSGAEARLRRKLVACFVLVSYMG